MAPRGGRRRRPQLGLALVVPAARRHAADDQRRGDRLRVAEPVVHGQFAGEQVEIEVSDGKIDATVNSGKIWQKKLSEI